MGSHENVQNGSSDEDARKLFIGGIVSHATTEDVEGYFSKYGEVSMCTIKTDVYTGRSRGFGFLIFKDVSSVEQVLADNAVGHEICGKKVDPKLATPQSGSGGGQDEKNNKVFVGGLAKMTTKEDIQGVFATRGTVTDVFLPTDRATSEPKGFAFVTFDNTEIPETLCAEGKITINGKECDIKKANSKSESRGGGRGGFRGGRGGRGGFHGGYGGGYDQGGYGGGYGGGYEGYNSYQGGYGQSYGGGYDQYSSGGYDQSGGYGGGNAGGYGGGYDQSQGYQSGGYSSGDQYKMKAGRGRGGGYNPY